MKRVFLILGLALTLVVANLTIFRLQAIVDDGEPMLLKLRPVDPRSLMQGDYMVLRYDEMLFPPRETRDDLPVRGRFVVTVDADRIATFSRLDDGTALAADERLLAYKQVDARGTIRLGAESFFFQEGRAGDFDPAQYGVLHVDEAGKSVLVGLADEDARRID